MPDAAELNLWIERLKQSKKQSELLRKLDEFRRLDWTDEQRAAIAKLYMRLLDMLPEEKEEAKANEESAAGNAQEQNPADEEVWYEKM